MGVNRKLFLKILLNKIFLFKKKWSNNKIKLKQIMGLKIIL